MNKIEVRLKEIKRENELTITSFYSKKQTLKMMSLELDKNIEKAKKIILTTKATNIAIAKEYQGLLSYSNQLKTTIKKIEIGDLLCRILLSFEDTLLESIITADSAKRMDLQPDQKVTALIKSTDISILKVIE